MISFRQAHGMTKVYWQKKYQGRIVCDSDGTYCFYENGSRSNQTLYDPPAYQTLEMAKTETAHKIEEWNSLEHTKTSMLGLTRKGREFLLDFVHGPFLRKDLPKERRIMADFFYKKNVLSRYLVGRDKYVAYKLNGEMADYIKYLKTED